MNTVEQVFNDLTIAPSRAKLLSLQEYCNQHGHVVEGTNPCVTKEYFAPGVYCREIFMPAGELVLGKIHKHAHLNTILCGRAIVATEFGVEEIVAGTFISPPGTKRALVIVEDMIWTTYHPNPNNETDPAVLEEFVIAKTYEELDIFLGGVE